MKFGGYANSTFSIRWRGVEADDDVSFGVAMERVGDLDGGFRGAMVDVFRGWWFLGGFEQALVYYAGSEPVS